MCSLGSDMAATSASAFSIRSTISHGSKASPLSQSKTCGMNISFNSQNNIKSFTGLTSSFLAKEKQTLLMSFIVDDTNGETQDDDITSEDSESDDADDHFDPVCAICDNGGRLT
ncbi:uncharacterized protein LOC110884781 [Helianthus annuus]|uniref:uncharacterized protein LOC110884781 n=1 Tax=Helianthus annuus TaxID=4232 RepID=UPI001652C6AB|nr:uncharacterized protein LOC110884781 [Helianthus annuus]